MKTDTPDHEELKLLDERRAEAREKARAELLEIAHNLLVEANKDFIRATKEPRHIVTAQERVGSAICLLKTLLSPVWAKEVMAEEEQIQEEGERNRLPKVIRDLYPEMTAEYIDKLILDL